MKRFLYLVALICGFAFASEFCYENAALNPVTFEKPVEHKDIVLVKDGELNVVLAYDFAVEPKETTARERCSIKLAVEALKDAFQRTTGKVPETVNAAEPLPAGKTVIALGKSAITDKLGLKPLDMPKEAFLVKSFDNCIVIAGHDGSLIPNSYNKMDWTRYRINGTLNGAYDFAERILGMRYYFPGIGIVGPEHKNLSVKPVSYTDCPKYRNRFNWGYARDFQKGYPWKEAKGKNNFDYAWRMAMSTRFVDVCHTPSVQVLAKNFPEKKDLIFYTDPKTGYQYYNPSTHIGNLMDITNKEVADFLVDGFVKFYESNGEWKNMWSRGKGKGTWYPPNSEYVLFSQADTYVKSMNNEKTAKFFPPGREGITSDLYMNFYVWLAQGIKEKLPGKRLGVLAYHNYTQPPVVVKDIPDNLDVQVCVGRIVAAPVPSIRQSWEKIFREWYEVLGNRKVTAWTYGSQGNSYTQAIQGRYMKDFLQVTRPYMSEDGLFFDASGLRWKFYYSYYPVYRCFWNPDFNVKAAIDEHWNLLYGPDAGPILKQFYDLLVERWETAGASAWEKIKKDGKGGGSNVGPTVLYTAFNIPTVDKLEKLLAQARKAVKPGSIEALRVEYFASPWKKDFTETRAFLQNTISTYQIKQLGRNDSITVDGKLDEAIWAKADLMQMKDAKGAGTELVSKPQVKLLWSKEGLYLGFKCFGKPVINKGDIWFDSDNFEFFLSPGINKECYYQFAMNPNLDFVLKYKVEKPMEAASVRWNCEGLLKATQVEENSWSAELFIPFKGLNNMQVPKAYSECFGTFINNKQDPKTKKACEYSSFSLTMGNNHNHALWGRFKFMGKGD